MKGRFKATTVRTSNRILTYNEPITKENKMTIAELLGIQGTNFRPIVIKDGADRIIYREVMNGDWDRTEYDDDGNEILFEDSTGFKRVLDLNKNEVVCSSPNGLAKGYDENGNMVFFDDSPQQKQ
jgi:hypothetical protein